MVFFLIDYARHYKASVGDEVTILKKPIKKVYAFPSLSIEKIEKIEKLLKHMVMPIETRKKYDESDDIDFLNDIFHEFPIVAYDIYRLQINRDEIETRICREHRVFSNIMEDLFIANTGISLSYDYSREHWDGKNTHIYRTPQFKRRMLCPPFVGFGQTLNPTEPTSWSPQRFNPTLLPTNKKRKSDEIEDDFELGNELDLFLNGNVDDKNNDTPTRPVSPVYSNNDALSPLSNFDTPTNYIENVDDIRDPDIMGNDHTTKLDGDGNDDDPPNNNTNIFGGC